MAYINCAASESKNEFSKFICLFLFVGMVPHFKALFFRKITRIDLRHFGKNEKRNVYIKSLNNFFFLFWPKQTEMAGMV